MRLREGEDIDSALRRFKMEVQREGKLAKLREKECYAKPGVQRRNKRKANKAKRSNENRY